MSSGMLFRQSMCACACAHSRVCARAFVHACARASACTCVRAHAETAFQFKFASVGCVRACLRSRMCVRNSMSLTSPHETVESHTSSRIWVLHQTHTNADTACASNCRGRASIVQGTHSPRTCADQLCKQTATRTISLLRVDRSTTYGLQIRYRHPMRARRRSLPIGL